MSDDTQTTRMQTRSQTRSQKSETKTKIQKKTHPFGWTEKFHYSSFGCYCGQSCPCCRARVGDTFGACPICLENKKLLEFP
jgi:hypothetical protein